MKKILIITIALLAFAGFNSCVETTTSGTQATQVTSTSKTVKMKPFVDVNVIGSMQVLYSTGKSNEVRVEAMKEAFDKLVIYVKENELYITSKDENLDSASLIQDVKVYVSSPSLREVSLTGAFWPLAIASTISTTLAARVLVSLKMDIDCLPAIIFFVLAISQS